MYVTVYPCVGTSGANIFLSSHMYTDGVVETNMSAVAHGGEMYAEVDEMQKMKIEASGPEQGRSQLTNLSFVNPLYVLLYSGKVSRGKNFHEFCSVKATCKGFLHEI